MPLLIKKAVKPRTSPVGLVANGLFHKLGSPSFLHQDSLYQWHGYWLVFLKVPCLIFKHSGGGLPSPSERRGLCWLSLFSYPEQHQPRCLSQAVNGVLPLPTYSLPAECLPSQREAIAALFVCMAQCTCGIPVQNIGLVFAVSREVLPTVKSYSPSELVVVTSGNVEFQQPLIVPFCIHYVRI